MTRKPEETVQRVFLDVFERQTGSIPSVDILSLGFFSTPITEVLIDANISRPTDSTVSEELDDSRKRS